MVVWNLAKLEGVIFYFLFFIFEFFNKKLEDTKSFVVITSTPNSNTVGVETNSMFETGFY